MNLGGGIKSGGVRISHAEGITKDINVSYIMTRGKRGVWKVSPLVIKDSTEESVKEALSLISQACTGKDIENIKAVTREDILRVYETYIKGRPHIVTSCVPGGQPEMIEEPELFFETGVNGKFSVKRVLPEEQIKDRFLLMDSGLPVSIGHGDLVKIRQNRRHQFIGWLHPPLLSWKSDLRLPTSATGDIALLPQETPAEPP